MATGLLLVLLGGLLTSYSSDGCQPPSSKTTLNLRLTLPRLYHTSVGGIGNFLRYARYWVQSKAVDYQSPPMLKLS